ncbi:alpha/beta fold hydrolase [Pseudoxanthomonas sacheonensis]|uniref:Pimeloyl-ACP methyl ester carboxylesterase n=1 Tax=Pseudoxanthomonas sacheonensis TaxID=443615 RepID=A0ABU1RTN5_9GAMM|nr:alpha/beta hydrolase [Pseudoxanthomonas sacheonensis]MDR6842129.1 pimeloyl-ACP methyl ester carboxylesterase [Pseudoxanthomonas sacheonensis]
MRPIRDDVEVNGIRMHYAMAGRGDPVLLLHGFPGTSSAWRKVIPLLEKTHTVIAPDMRGFGDSGKPADGYDAHTIIADFRALLKHIGVGPVHIVAHGMGAPPALVWAGTYPDEVRTLAYLDQPTITGPCMREVSQFTEEGTVRGGFWWWPFALAPELAEMLFAGHEREMLSWFYRYYCANPRVVDQEYVAETARTFAAPGGARGAMGVYRALFETQMQTEPFIGKRIRVPLLALGGDESFGDRTREMLATVAENVQGCVLSNCGHFISEEKPSELVEHLSEFWRSTVRIDRLLRHRSEGVAAIPIDIPAAAFNPSPSTARATASISG